MLLNDLKLTPKDVFGFTRILPVVVVHDLAQILPWAQALLEDGIQIMEITLRTSVALDAIELIRKRYPEMLVGAGTVLNPAHLRTAVDAGAQFSISPGATPQLLEAGRLGPVPFIPGISSVSELMLGIEYGYDHFKFFPAESSGGVPALTAFYGPFPEIRFCPTGGIQAHNYRQYLALPNVDCVGGSWILGNSQ